MGCDIHMFIEYKDKSDIRWWGFGKEISPSRYYELFGKLAGVRNYANIKPIVEPRGLPEDCSWQVFNEYTLCIDEQLGDIPNYYTKTQADEWVNNGYFKYISQNRIINPDWHHASWLTPSEYEQALNEVSYLDIEYEIILIVLKGLEKHGKDARVVFWFDN